jgi:MFS family permease
VLDTLGAINVTLCIAKNHNKERAAMSQSAAEAGFFPGVVLYLSQWFPTFRRGRIMALFMSAIPVSGLLGSPFSGWILNHFGTGQGGLAGWQWMFLLQGIPTVILGALAYFLLSDSYANAK